MDGFKAVWTNNSIAIGAVLTLAALGLAAAGLGIPAVVLGLVGGTAFMWHARTIITDTGEED